MMGIVSMQFLLNILWGIALLAAVVAAVYCLGFLIDLWAEWRHPGTPRKEGYFRAKIREEAERRKKAGLGS